MKTASYLLGLIICAYFVKQITDRDLLSLSFERYLSYTFSACMLSTGIVAFSFELLKIGYQAILDLISPVK